MSRAAISGVRTGSAASRSAPAANRLIAPWGGLLRHLAGASAGARQALSGAELRDQGVAVPEIRPALRQPGPPRISFALLSGTALDQVRGNVCEGTCSAVSAGLAGTGSLVS